MAIETVPAASQGADTIAVPSHLLENLRRAAQVENTIAVPLQLLLNIRRAIGDTIDRQVVIDDLCTLGIGNPFSDCTDSLLTAIKASQGNDADGLTELTTEIDALLGVQHG